MNPIMTQKGTFLFSKHSLIVILHHLRTKEIICQEIRKELKLVEAKTANLQLMNFCEVELKDLPPHLEYAFLEANNKLPVIIAKDLSVDE
ncbi:hypothetical protein Tco_0411637 [Tanacetum coccineum]